MSHKWTAVFGALGGFGMAVFFGTALVTGWDAAPAVVMIPSGLAMWIGYPASWFMGRRSQGASSSSHDPPSETAVLNDVVGGSSLPLCDSAHAGSGHPWASDEFRAEVNHLLERIRAHDVEPAAKALWSTAFREANRWVFAAGLWNIWGGITDEFTHPRGDWEEGLRLSRESAAALAAVLGDQAAERRYCDDWIKRICG